jgi:ProP effector
MNCCYYSDSFITNLTHLGHRMRKQALHPRTASINSKQKTQAKLARHQALCWLAETFPQAFDNRERIQPLKLGIMEDILAHADAAADAGISKSKLREAVVIFTRRVDYLACLKAQEVRVDLTGHPIAQVTQEEAERAGIKIKKRIEKGIKNTRKASPIKTPMPQQTKQPSTHQSIPKPLPPHQYPESAHYTQNTQQAPKRTTAITIKPSRAYDPNAVARLKEKLGLRKEELTEN